MKHLKPLATNLTKSLVLLFFITLVNCKDDNMTSDHIAEHQHPPIARFAIDDLPEIEQVISQFSISRTSRTMNTSFGDLDLSDIVQYINTDGKYTYTFKVRNSQDLASELDFENLHLIRLPDDNGYLAYIVRWQPNAEWYQNKDYLFSLGDFTGQASRFDLEYNHLSTTTFVNGSPIEDSSDSSGSREMKITCYDVVTCGCTGVPYYCDCTQPGCERNFSTACTTSGGSPINDNTDTGSTGTHIGGSGTGQPPYVPGGDADVIVESPTYDDYIELCLSSQNTSGGNSNDNTVSNWINAVLYGQRKALGIYLQDNTCSEQAQAFAEAVIEAGPDAEVDYLNVVIKDESFIDSQTDCIFEKLKANNNGDNFFKTMLEEFDILNASLKFSIGTTPNPNAAAITKGSIVDFFGTSYASYEIVTATNIENNSSNLDKMVTLSHEVMHAFMFKSLEEWGIIEFTSDGNPKLIQNTNDLCENVDLDEEINLNLLTTKEKWVFLICEFLINNPANTEEWTHSLFESPVFVLETYREKLEQLLLNTHDWDNEPYLVKETMIQIFGANNWKQKVSEYMSWSGLEETPEFETWLTTQDSFVPVGSIYTSNRDFFDNGVTGYWTQNYNVTENCN